MGDRLQEGGLHLIHRPEVLGRGPLALQGGSQLVGGLLLAVQRLRQAVGGQVGGGDVGQDPLPEQGWPSPARIRTASSWIQRTWPSAVRMR